MKGLICFAAIFLFLSTICIADEIKGKVTAVDAAGGIIEVSGVKILAEKAKIENFDDSPCKISELKVGDIVEVEGVFSGAGEMTATEIERKVNKHDYIEGKLEQVNIAARTLLVGGVTVNVLNGAKLEGDDDKDISLKDLVIGNTVECEGAWTGFKEFSASKIEMDD